MEKLSMTFSGLRYHKKQWEKRYNYQEIKFNLYDVINGYYVLNNENYYVLKQFNNPEKDFTIVNHHFDYQNIILYVDLKMDVR